MEMKRIVYSSDIGMKYTFKADSIYLRVFTLLFLVIRMWIYLSNGMDVNELKQMKRFDDGIDQTRVVVWKYEKLVVDRRMREGVSRRQRCGR